MKQVLLALLGLCLSMAAEAKQWTVSNNASIPAQFTNLTAAITAAGRRDTLIVAASGTSYGDITLAKPLTIIGGGGFSCTLTTLTLDSTSATAQADSSYISSFNISSTLTVKPGVGNIILERLQVTSNFNMSTTPTSASISSMIIRNCILSAVNGGDKANGLFFSNCYFTGGATAKYCIVKNSLFFGAGYSTYISACVGTTFSNNIFLGSLGCGYGSGGPGNSSGNSFYNNLTFNTKDSTLPYGANSGSANIRNKNPKFVLMQNTTCGYYSINDNYALQAGSPAHNAGEDGTDIGPTGGSFPCTLGLVGLPPLPNIQQLSLTTTTVPSTGSLNVRVKAKKGN